MLIALACSATKRDDPGTMPAIDRYDGPMWQTLRAALAELGDKPLPDVWFLSARYGFQPATMPIVNYDGVLSEARARDLLRIPSSNRAEFGRTAFRAGRVLLAGGTLYRETMKRAIPVPERRGMTITETDGAGIGEHRAQLRAWIKEHCS